MKAIIAASKRRRAILIVAAALCALIVISLISVPGPILRIRLSAAQLRSVLRLATPEQREWASKATDMAALSPTVDAMRSIALGDYRLVSVIGFGRFHPGIPKEIDKEIGESYEYDRLEVGIGDCSMCEYDELYHSISYEYAKRYNQIMWSFFKRWRYKRNT